MDLGDAFNSTYIFPPLMLFVLFLAIVFIGCLLFQAFCILWSPFAAIICAVDAHRGRMSVWRYAVAGGLCSIFLSYHGCIS